MRETIQNAETLPVYENNGLLCVDCETSDMWEFIAVFRELPLILESKGHEYRKISYRFDNKEKTIFYKVQP